LLLAVFIGNPWPAGGVNLAAPLTDDAIIGLLTAICWVLWAQVAVCVLAEIAAAMRGLSIPVRVPATFARQQQLARILVSCVVTVTVASPFTAGLRSTAPARPVQGPRLSTVASAMVHPHLDTPHPETAPRKPLPSILVARGDSLWSLAATHLGSGERWTEIAQLNQGHTMNDGTVFRSENLLLPGWELIMPPNSTGLTARAPSISSARPATVTVQRGDTLSGIAQRRLGDADAWPALWDANKTLIDDPNLILPGWTLVIPDTAAQQQLPPGTSQQSPHSRQARHHHPRPAHNTTGPSAVPLPPPFRTPAEPPTDSHTAGTGDSPDHQVETRTGTELGNDVDSLVSVRALCGVGSLLAAGIVVLLGGRRTRQRLRRPLGGRVPMPTGAAAALEMDLRANQDPGSVQTVDRALRSLAMSCRADRRPLPVVTVVRLTGTRLELYLAEATVLPSPWKPTIDETVWTIERDAVRLIDPVSLHGVAAPYPALVTLGVDQDNAHVMVDLESCGTLGLVGDDEAARRLLSALAVELATSRWADDLLITVVGAQPELEHTLATGRVAYRATAGDLIDQLTHQAEQARRVLTETGTTDLQHARAAGDLPGLCTPQIVLLATDLTDPQRDQLSTATQDRPRVAVAAVTTRTQVGPWVLRFTGDSAALLEPLGLHLQPQRLDDETYLQVMALLDLADQKPIEAAFDILPEPTLDDARAANANHTPDGRMEPRLEAGAGVPAEADQESIQAQPTAGVDAAKTTRPPISPRPSDAPPSAEHDTTHAAPQMASTEFVDSERDAIAPRLDTPHVLVLGRPVVEHTRGPSRRDARPEQATELVAFLALHGPATAAQIDQAFWPGRRVGAGTRDTFVSRARTWLGTDSYGNPYLLKYSAGDLYRLSDDVTTDWDVLRRLVGPDPQQALTGDLERALSLVRGRPFDGVRDDRYAWADIDVNEMIATIADASYELARRRLVDGKLRSVHTAALVGLGVEPGCERLSRLRIEAAAAGGDPTLVADIVRAMYVAADQTESDLEPETTVLLAQLKPTAGNRLAKHR
jgi:LysM repeat protein